MTKKELIEKLAEFPDDIDICLLGQHWKDYPISEVRLEDGVVLII